MKKKLANYVVEFQNDTNLCLVEKQKSILIDFKAVGKQMNGLAYITEPIVFPNKDPSPHFKLRHEDVKFDASKHLCFEDPEYVVNMNFERIPFDSWKTNKTEELAFTSPFRILTDEGIQEIKKIIKSYENDPYINQSNDRHPLCMRGLSRVSTFIRDLNRCSIIDDRLSIFAHDPVCAHGMTFNYSQINVGKIGSDRPVDMWHVDSVDYVLVIILSDMEGAEGGELQVATQNRDSALNILRKKGRLDNTECMTVKYPGAGYAIFMQGSKILHHVTAVKSAKEPRMSLVNSYMTRNVFKPDMTRYRLFQESDSKDISGLDFARQKAWRVGGMMKYIVEEVNYGDEFAYLSAIEKAIEELTDAREILKGVKDDRLGYFDEKRMIDRKKLIEGNHAQNYDV